MRLPSQTFRGRVSLMADLLVLPMVVRWQMLEQTVDNTGSERSQRPHPLCRFLSPMPQAYPMMNILQRSPPPTPQLVSRFCTLGR